MCRGSSAANIEPAGSSARRAVPSSAPPSAWKYHHGSPLIAGTTVVAAPTRDAVFGSSAAIACALSPMTTRSCSPKSAGSVAGRQPVDTARAADVIDEPQTFAPDRIEMCTARDQYDVMAAGDQLGTDDRADRSGTDDGNAHPGSN